MIQMGMGDENIADQPMLFGRQVAQTAAGINQYPFVDAQAGGVLAGAYAAAAAKDLDLQTFFLIRQTVYRQCYQAVLRANRAAISTSSRCSGVRKRIA